uniref:Uncharacterized protein n=1 Tax=Pristionchus pacificus TaxID=54126 RepID=A0A2A6CM94_PRIPA|eukprot:PDM79218.1 hypothetical protein PRIPAC_31797 [Pristionchus pacificus]
MKHTTNTMRKNGKVIAGTNRWGVSASHKTPVQKKIGYVVERMYQRWKKVMQLYSSENEPNYQHRCQTTGKSGLEMVKEGCNEPNSLLSRLRSNRCLLSSTAGSITADAVQH